MADTNRTSLKYIIESTWGTTPSTHMNNLRMTGESLGFNISNIVSNELRSDRQTTDLVQTGAENSGGFNGEISYGAYDEFLKGALWSAGWSSDVGLSAQTTISASASGPSFGDTGNGFGNVVAGQWVRVDGFTAATNNGYFLVTAATASRITVSGTLDNAAAGDSVDVAGSYIRNSTTRTSYSIQRAHEDMSPVVYFHFKGMVINTMTMNVEAEAISTISFDFIGSSTLISGTKMDGAAFSDTASAANDVLNGVSHCAQIHEGTSLGTPVASALIRGLSFTVGNNIRGKKSIGTLGNTDVGGGKVDVTGTMSAYFLDKDLYEKYVGGTETALTFKLEDDAATTNYGNAYIFTFHRIKFESDAVNAGRADADVMEDITWRAIRNATYDCTIQIDRFAAD